MGIILLGCSENQRTSPKLDFVSYNKEKGILLIDNKKLNGKKLKVIEILSNSDIQKQSIFVDSNLTCYRISNFKNVFWKNNYENNWISFDDDGNLDFSESYFYETSLFFENEKVFIECYLKKPLLQGRQYVLLGGLDDKYRFTSKIDTFFFNIEGSVQFPDLYSKKGKNNIRFIIIDEQKIDGIIQRRLIYAKKNYVLK